MLYIFLTVVVSVLLLIIFKAFKKYEVNSFISIVVNYIIAAITGFVFLDSEIDLSSVYKSDWVFICIPLAFLFIAVFYLIALTAQKISISTASVANKMSVIMPVLYSVLFLGQQLSIVKITGVLLAMLAVYLSTFSSTKKQINSGLFWLPIAVFFGSGFIDIAINAANALYLKTTSDSAMFSIFTFLFAFTIGLLTVLYLIFFKKTTSIKQVFKLKNIIGGVVLGVPNYFSIFFIFKSLESNALSSAQLFPVLNLSNVALSALVAWLIFKEKISILNFAGIILAVISILLISF